MTSQPQQFPAQIKYSLSAISILFTQTWYIFSDTSFLRSLYPQTHTLRPAINSATVCRWSQVSSLPLGPVFSRLVRLLILALHLCQTALSNHEYSQRRDSESEVWNLKKASIFMRATKSKTDFCRIQVTTLYEFDYEVKKNWGRSLSKLRRETLINAVSLKAPFTKVEDSTLLDVRLERGLRDTPKRNGTRLSRELTRDLWELGMTLPRRRISAWHRMHNQVGTHTESYCGSSTNHFSCSLSFRFSSRRRTGICSSCWIKDSPLLKVTIGMSNAGQDVLQVKDNKMSTR